MGVGTKTVDAEAVPFTLLAATPDDGMLRHRPPNALLSPPVPAKMSYEAFLEWANEDTLAEWVNGEVVMTSPANDRHQDLSGFLGSVLRTFVETYQLGAVRPAPYQMRLAHSGREPDLLFVSREHLARLRETYLDGPADLVVEIISPESVERDRGDKFYEYEEGGVPEYWLIDPQTETAEFYRLEAGRYRLAVPDDAGCYHSRALAGFWLRVDWLWQRPLPQIEEVMLEIGGESYARQWIERLRQHEFLSATIV